MLIVYASKNLDFPSFRQSHQQLPSSHATDRLTVVTAVDVRIDVARAEVQEVSVARTIRSRRPIAAVGPRIVQRASVEVAAAQKVVGGVHKKEPKTPLTGVAQNISPDA